MSYARRLSIVFALLGLSQTAQAETLLVFDADSEELCQVVDFELSEVGIEALVPKSAGDVRRARRQASLRERIEAVVACQSEPARIEVFYPDGSRLGRFMFSVPADDDATSAAVYASERIRSERLVDGAVARATFAPALWWMGIAGDVLLSPGGIAPLAFVTVDLGYRFHRYWSFSGFASVQPYMRTLSSEGLETKQRLDQFGLSLAYHPVVSERVDLSFGVRASASRLGVNGEQGQSPSGLRAQRDAVWLAFVGGRLTLRVSLSKRLWLRIQGDVGALAPRAEVSAPASSFGSLGEFGAQTGLGLEVQFR